MSRRCALIIGSGKNVSNELQTVDKSTFGIVIGVNRAAIDHGPVDVQCSLHPEHYASKKAAYFVSAIPHKLADEVHSRHWGNSVSSGSSGMFAVHYAIERLGFNEVLLAGIPIEKAPHYYGGGDWADAERFQKVWRQMLPLMRGKVFSLGGWTQQLLNPLGEMPPSLREASLCH